MFPLIAVATAVARRRVAPDITSVSITGSGELGTVHTATVVASLGYPASTLTYQWLLGGVAISGEESATYTPTAEGSLTVTAYASDEGTGADEMTSSPVTITTPSLAAPVITNAGTIASDGTLGKIGSSHTVTGFAVTGSDITLTYQWERGGTPITDATAANYVPVEADNGTNLTRVTTATNSGGTDSDETATQAITFVAPVKLTDGAWTEDAATGVQTYDANPHFSAEGDADLSEITWSLDATAGGASIDAGTGIISLNTGTSGTFTNSTITVRATNSGGFTTCAITTTVASPVTASSIGTLVAQSYSVSSGATSTYSIAAQTTGTTPHTYSMNARVLDADIIDLGNEVYGLGVVYAGTPAPTLTYDWQVGGVTTGVTAATFDNAVHLRTGNLTCEVTATNTHLAHMLETGSVALVATGAYSDYYGPNGEVPKLILDFHNEVYARDTGSGLVPIADITTFITGYTALVTGTDAIQRLRTSGSDVPSIATSNWTFSATAGTVKCKYRSASIASGDVVWSLNTDSNNRIRLACAAPAGLTTRFHIRSGAADQTNNDISATFEDDTATTTVVAWQGTSYHANGSKNGDAVGTPDNSGTLPTVNDLHLGFNEGTGGQLGGGIELFVYWNTRIADADLPEMSESDEPYEVYFGPNGEVPTLILDFTNAIYAADTGSGLAPVTTAIITNFTSVASGKLTIGGTSNPRVATSAFTFSPTAGTVLMEWRTTSTAAGDHMLNINDGGSNNNLRIYADGGTSWRGFCRVAGATQANLTGTAVTHAADQACAFAWAANDFAASIDGGAAATDTSGTIPTGLTFMSLGCNNGTGNTPEGGIYRVIYWPERIADADLVTLST